MKVSIVELGTVRPGETEVDGLADAVVTARHADALGFHRVWFAEHHLASSNASHHPELLIAAAGAVTRGIRVGSGSVLLNHYSPFKVAEMFQQLEAMYPGRVDLGMGRATSGQVIDLALQPDRASRPVDDHRERVSEVLAWLYERFPDGHPFAGHPLMPSVPHVPQTWPLGSSSQGPALAGELGLGYAFAGFIHPLLATDALQEYRRAFRPRGFDAEHPRAMLAVNVAMGEDDADGDRLALSAKGFYARLMRGGIGATMPTPEQALRELAPAQRDEPTTIVGDRWPRFVAGGPERVRATLEQMLEASGADELMCQNLIAAPEDRRGSHARIAAAFGLEAGRTTRRIGPPGAADVDGCLRHLASELRPSLIRMLCGGRPSAGVACASNRSWRR
ncbi:MsnO8 family LLM class oxidoreductase [Patulibacter sp. NPDC049589]|uniref:MsnO8 family LLM class oxidoreductase n=1 Tax=Patulibacter sp. NPDC049589 TaxID=3154731 RepID=UPI00342BDD32